MSSYIWGSLSMLKVVHVSFAFPSLPARLHQYVCLHCESKLPQVGNTVALEAV